MSRGTLSHVFNWQSGVLRIWRILNLPRLRSGWHLAVPHDHRHSIRTHVFQTGWQCHRTIWSRGSRDRTTGRADSTDHEHHLDNPAGARASYHASATRRILCIDDHRLSTRGTALEARADGAAAVWSCDAGYLRWAQGKGVDLVNGVCH
jgi:hypothetical protein